MEASSFSTRPRTASVVCRPAALAWRSISTASAMACGVSSLARIPDKTRTSMILAADVHACDCKTRLNRKRRLPGLMPFAAHLTRRKGGVRRAAWSRQACCAALQSALVSNQQVVYALRPEARSRINTLFMGSVLLGGAAGSALATVAWSRFGWAPLRRRWLSRFRSVA